MTITGAIFAALAAAALILSGPGTRWGWWDFKVGLLLFAAAFVAGLLALLISGIAWLRTRPNPTAAIATITGALIVLLPLAQVAGARGKPRIHDISTDLANPPHFSAILPLRASAANGAPDRIDDVTAGLQRAGYPDLATLDLPLAENAAFAKAVEAAKAMEWEIVSMRPADGILEATATTAWFGFRDDIVVRIRPAGEHSRVDVRSTSRVGRGDAGKNADRIRRYFHLLKTGN
jgi:branched-subunit amino acid ABC-type transport system permease component